MKEKTPSNEALRKKGGVIDQRNQQIDPAGERRADPNEVARRSQKQPGQDLRDPQVDADHGDEPKHAREKRTPPGKRQNAQGDPEGSAHSPDEFDVMNPQKQGLGDKKPDQSPAKPDGER
ncbi:hypothetical protein RNZ50_01410 [Paracoccaceae bacterium Fryx2]|nr:hypothetical protein [Paracoccaceae bacterium Fryx2]